MQQNFKKLCKICDKLLKENKENRTLNAISYLHILRGHPEILKEYNFFFKKNNLSIKKYFIDLHFVLKFFFFIISVLTNGKLFYYLKEPKKIDCLIISHLINPDHLKKENDFYFGTLQSKLLNYRLSSLVALRNFTGKNLNSLSKFKSNKKYYKVILSNYFKIRIELKSIILFLYEFFRIRLLKNKSAIKSNLLKSVGKPIHLKSIFSNIRISEQINFLINFHKPKYVFITYEGHAWERVAIRKIKENYPEIIIIAYQFSIITKYHHSIFRPLSKIYNPNFIMTSGSVTADYFKKSKMNHNSEIIIYGTDKYIHNTKKKLADNNFLILPEGFLDETKILLDFSILAANSNPKFKFLFRFHPLVQKKDFIKNNYFFKLPKNLIISENSLENDFKECKYAIYRGTATIIEAVSYGLIPLFYKLPKEINFDPLFKFPSKLFKITNESQLKKLMLKENLIQKEFLLIKEYCKNYFQKPILNSLKYIINK
jgi:hypothetical protein